MFVHLSNHLRNKSRERVEEITGVSPKTPSTAVDESIDYTDDTQSTTYTVSTIFSDNNNSSPLSRSQVSKYRSHDNGGGSSPNGGTNIYFNEVNKLSKTIDENISKTNEMVLSSLSSSLSSLLSS